MADQTKVVQNGRARVISMLTAESTPDTTDADERAATLAKAKREMGRAKTAAQVRAVVAKYKLYRKLVPMITTESVGTKRTLTVGIVTKCQKDLNACQSKADVQGWVAANIATLGTRKAGRLLSYPATDPASLVD
jgi:hypothetical protein